MVNDGTSRYRQSDPGHDPRPADGRSNAADPLAELARMMAQEDEFAALMRELPRQKVAAGGGQARPVAAPRPQPAPAPRPAAPRPTPGSFAALAAEVYTESAQRAAAPAPRAERAPADPNLRDPYARPATPRPVAPAPQPAPAPRVAAPEERAAPPSWMSRANPAPAAPVDRDTTFDLDLEREDDVYDYGRSSDDDGYDADGEDDYRHVADEAPRRSRRRLLMAGAALGVLVIGGAGAYALFGGNGGPVTIGGSQPPVIRAAQEPSKVVPAPTQPADAAADGQKLIYDRVGGTASTGSEKVVSSEEQPVDVSQAAQPQPRVIQQAPSQSAPAAAAPSSTEPKRVRTLTVRADGSIVEGEPAPTPSPAVASAAQPTASAAVALSNGSATQASTNPAPLASTPSIVPNVPAAPTRVATAPAAQPSNTTQALNAAANSVPTPNGAYVVQIGSVPSEQDAHNMLRTAISRYPGLLGGKPASVRRGDVSTTGGVTYRAQVGAFQNRNDAVTLCEQLKAQGGSCFVSRI